VVAGSTQLSVSIYWKYVYSPNQRLSGITSSVACVAQVEVASFRLNYDLILSRKAGLPLRVPLNRDIAGRGKFEGGILRIEKHTVQHSNLPVDIWKIEGGNPPTP
jgi:hypothetical protein